jgi:hypothetical protein
VRQQGDGDDGERHGNSQQPPGQAGGRPGQRPVELEPRPHQRHDDHGFRQPFRQLEMGLGRGRLRLVEEAGQQGADRDTEDR